MARSTEPVDVPAKECNCCVPKPVIIIVSLLSAALLVLLLISLLQPHTVSLQFRDPEPSSTARGQLLKPNYMVYKDGSGNWRALDLDAANETVIVPSYAPESAATKLLDYRKDDGYVLLGTNSRRQPSFKDYPPTMLATDNRSMWSRLRQVHLKPTIFSYGSMIITEVTQGRFVNLLDGLQPKTLMDLIGAEKAGHDSKVGWNYESQVMGSDKSFWLSPSGSRLMVLNVNYSRNIECVHKGEALPAAELKIFPITSDTIKYDRYKVISSQHSEFPVLKYTNWIDNVTVVVLWTNRAETVARVKACGDNDCALIGHILIPPGWKSPPSYLDAFIMPHAAGSRYVNHLSRIDIDKQSLIHLTSGNYSVTRLVGRMADHIIYMATVEGHPNHQHVYAYYLTGRSIQCLSCDIMDDLQRPQTYFEAEFIEPHLLVRSLGPTLLQSFVYKLQVDIATGYVSRTAELINGSQNETTSIPRRIILDSIVLDNGVEAIYRLVLPTYFDGKQKYPLLLEVYRDGLSVTDDLRRTSMESVNTSVIILNVDVPAEVDDDLFAILLICLCDKFPFIDRDRMGVWGWGRSAGTVIRALVGQKIQRILLKCGAVIDPIFDCRDYYKNNSMGNDVVRRKEADEISLYLFESDPDYSESVQDVVNYLQPARVVFTYHIFENGDLEQQRSSQLNKYFSDCFS